MLLFYLYCSWLLDMSLLMNLVCDFNIIHCIFIALLPYNMFYMFLNLLLNHSLYNRLLLLNYDCLLYFFLDNFSLLYSLHRQLSQFFNRNWLSHRGYLIYILFYNLSLLFHFVIIKLSVTPDINHLNLLIFNLLIKQLYLIATWCWLFLIVIH